MKPTIPLCGACRHFQPTKEKWLGDCMKQHSAHLASVLGFASNRPRAPNNSAINSKTFTIKLLTKLKYKGNGKERNEFY